MTSTDGPVAICPKHGQYSLHTGCFDCEDFLHRLRRVSAARTAAWAEGEEIDELFHAIELGGEVGEVLNVVKKLYRERRGWRGSRADIAKLREEIGDVLICLDKVAAHYGIDMAEAATDKFDATSRSVGLPFWLGDPVEAKS